MKKILTLLLALILLISLIIIMLNGNKLFHILSVKQIVDESKQLDQDIQETSRLIAVNYESSKKSLEDANSNLQKNKADYTELINSSQEEDIRSANEIKKYDIDFLWTILGSYATDNNLQLGIEVVKSNSITQNEYDLRFTLIGEYSDISDFISEIEEDSELNFKIENYKLNPTGAGTGTQDFTDLTATFNVEKIGLNLDTLK